MTGMGNDPAKPCIALMGEFSAGKSTLANLLIGSDPLPVQVVATQLPPVWISYGDEPAYRVDLEEEQHAVDINNLCAVPLEDTMYIRIFCKEDILQQCDLLDMPGISDPNMSSDVWRRMIGKANGVIWCSHATQAWRQSEAAVWSDVDPELHEHSILLLTRIDKLLTKRDQDRVLKRVRREVDGLFSACLPISLIQATSEQDDYEVWSGSGAAEFAEALADLLSSLQSELPFSGADDELSAKGALVLPAFVPPPLPDHGALESSAAPTPKIVPRRVFSTGPSRRSQAQS